MPERLKPLFATKPSSSEGEVYAEFYQDVLPEMLMDGELQALQNAKALAAKALMPAIPEKIITSLTKLSAHYWQGNKDQTGWSVVMEDYLEDLEDLPADLLDEACKRWRRNAANKFFPRAAELKAQISYDWCQRRMQLRRIEALLAPKAITRQVTCMEREAMAAGLQQLLEDLKSGFKEKPAITEENQ